MAGGIRRPLRLLAIAFGAAASLVLLQTFVLRAVPYDASYFGALSTMFRAAFVVADVAAIVALFVLGRRVPAIHAFTTTANLVFGLTVLCTAVDWLGSALSGGRSGSLGVVEPIFGFGATLLVVFVLAAVLGANPAPNRGRSAGLAAVLVVAVVVLGMRIASAVSHDAPNMVVAWVRWALAVAQPALLAGVALVVARAKEADDVSVDARAAAGAAGGGYRSAGEGAGVAQSVLPAPSPATIEPLRCVSSGIDMHRAAFIARAAVGGLVVLVAVGGAEIFAALFPIVGCATAIIIAVGLSRQRALVTFGGGASMLAAFVCFVVASVAEVGALLWIVGELLLRLHIGESGLLLFPAATFFGGLGILFASRAYERAGDLLFKYRLAGLARWTQSLLVLVVTTMLAVFFVNPRGSSMRSDLAPFMALGFALLTFGGLVAIAVVHAMTLGEASKVLKERIDQASAPGGS